MYHLHTPLHYNLCPASWKQLGWASSVGEAFISLSPSLSIHCEGSYVQNIDSLWEAIRLLCLWSFSNGSNHFLCKLSSRCTIHLETAGAATWNLKCISSWWQVEFPCNYYNLAQHQDTTLTITAFIYWLFCVFSMKMFKVFFNQQNTFKVLVKLPLCLPFKSALRIKSWSYKNWILLKVTSLPAILCLCAARAALFSALTAEQTIHLVCFPVPLSACVCIFSMCQYWARFQQTSCSYLLFLLQPLLTWERQLLFLHQHLMAQLAAFGLPNLSMSTYFLIRPLAAVGQLPDLELFALYVVFVSVCLPAL